MIKKSIRILPFFVFVLSIFTFSKLLSENSQVLHYSVGNKQFVIFVTKTKNTDDKILKEKAMKRASEIAKENGYKYYIIKKVSDTTIIVGKKDVRENFPSNIQREQEEYKERFDKDLRRSKARQKDALKMKIKLTNRKSRDAIKA